MGANSNEHITQAIKVEIVKNKDAFQLMRGGIPYNVLGAGAHDADLKVFADYGGNSIRTWSVNGGAVPTEQLLDTAYALGLTVSLGLEFAPERKGFNYDDPNEVAKQLANTRTSVLKYKDHPALLTWLVGNELNLNFTRLGVYDAVEQVTKMIHALDPNHPVTTTLAGFDPVALKAIEERAPSLDFVSFQMYADVVNLPKHIQNYGLKKPYMITEWGAIGHWEVAKTSWGAPIEATSSEKADHYAKSFESAIAHKPEQLIANYVFFWGQKQERTSTWYGMFLKTGERTEAVDVMSRIWTGKWPINRSPRVSQITLNGQVSTDNVTLSKTESYSAHIKTHSTEQDSLCFFWEIREESTSTNIGGDHEDEPSLLSGLISDPSASTIVFSAPSKGGAYRLFAFVRDGTGNAAHANFPFYVN